MLMKRTKGVREKQDTNCRHASIPKEIPKELERIQKLSKQ
jgi:hypothetical protein